MFGRELNSDRPHGYHGGTRPRYRSTAERVAPMTYRTMTLAMFALIQFATGQNQDTIEPAQTSTIVIEIGVGRSPTDIEFVFGGMLEKGRLLHGLRFSIQSEMDLFDAHTPDNKNMILDALVGVQQSISFVHLGAATGIGYIIQTRRGRLIKSGGGLISPEGPSVFETINQSTLGIPFHGSLTFFDPILGIFQAVVACHISISKFLPIWGI